MAPKGRIHASEERRRQILDAALELFLEAGVGDCRVDDLFERSGSSAGSFYHHFGSKPELAAALYLEILVKFQGDLLAVLNRHRSARSGVKGVIAYHLRWVVEDPQRATYLFQCLEPAVLAACREQENAMTTAFFGQIMEWLDRQVAADEIRKLSHSESYVLWMGPTLELTRTWLMARQRKWTWTGGEMCGPDGFLRAEKTLANAAWDGLRGDKSR